MAIQARLLDRTESVGACSLCKGPAVKADRNGQYRRVCPKTKKAWQSNHDEDDGVQAPCPHCGERHRKGRPAKENPKAAPKGEKGAENADPQEHKREYEMLVVLGPPAFGKTSLVDEQAYNYARRGGRVWVIDPNDAWKGVPYVRPVWPRDGIYGEDGKGNLNSMILWFENSGPGMLILDDADKYCRHATEAIDDLMTSFRHWQKDVIVVSRRPAGIPKDAIANANALALFHVREVNSRKYLTDQLSAEVVGEIPKMPHAYLYVRQDAYLTRETYRTKPRRVVTKSTKPQPGNGATYPWNETE